MRRLPARVAEQLCAAFLFTIASGCGPRAEDSARGAPTVAFAVGTDGSRSGEVSVYPLSRDLLAELEASRPLAEDWQRILSVRVSSGAGADSDALSLLGTYDVAYDTLYFRPRFPPASGVTYLARFDGAALYRHVGREPPPTLARVDSAAWRTDAAIGSPTTTVREIYPSGDVVPMNLLRMYVEFSAPMSSGRSYEFVKLYNEDGSMVEDPFFTAGDAVELWDPDHTRLTILFDPGRIKRDLKPHEELGLPLREGRRYRLVIDSGWRDAQGRPLARSHVKRFRVERQDRTLVRAADWRVTSPRAGTRDSLIVDLPEPLDRALLGRMLTVRDTNGAVTEGSVVVSDRETRWAFAPAAPWRSVPHALHVDAELEDLAGNNLKKLFDVAPGDTGAIGVSSTTVQLTFRPT